MSARRHPALPHRRQRGVAVVTALLLTTLAVTIVASLFWQQQVQVRSMENQRLQLQTKWILRGALDWSRLILRQDGQDHRDYTSLLDVWATPLAETRLDDYVERERMEGETFNASLSGQMSDAQARFNLSNLSEQRVPDEAQIAVFRRLLQNLQIDPTLAKSVAEQVAQGQPAPTMPLTAADGSEMTEDQKKTAAEQLAKQKAKQVPVTSGSEQMPIARAEDLLAVAGFNPKNLERLRDFIIVLPEKTEINVNTAPAEVLSALIENFSLAEATVLVNNRKRMTCKQPADFDSQLGTHHWPTGVKTSCKSNYFLVQSQVRLDRATLDSQALIFRDSANQYKTEVKWAREE
ncbi:type II secretion system minor pseudopilin GspK [Oxalobacteraceae bacterium]|nr:type II secretion system minor pseudopilin GspK [Oxalobacteraceae bacterium]